MGHDSTHSPMDVTERPRLVRAALVEVLDQGWVQNVQHWDPGPLFGTVTLPLHKKLPAVSPPTDGHHFFECVGQLAIYDARRR